MNRNQKDIEQTTASWSDAHPKELSRNFVG